MISSKIFQTQDTKTMKLFRILSAIVLLSMADAFAPAGWATPKTTTTVLGAQAEDHDVAILSRRDAIRQVATTAAMASFAAVSMTPDAALADIYDDMEKERKLKQKEDAENARKLVPGILIGGTALSVPFFLPNLLRLGKKFISLGENDGYGK